MFRYLSVVFFVGTLGGSQAYTYSGGYGQAYGGYSGGGGYGTCGGLKVTEVLDQIYCNHGYYTRFTSTDLAAIKVVLYELGLVNKFAHITQVLEYVDQGIYFLKDLKEETYKSYDTSELSKYYQNSGYDYSDLQGFINNMTTALNSFEDIRRGYRKQNPMIEWGTFTPDPYASEYSDNTYKKSKRMTKQVSLYPTSSVRRTRQSESEYDYAGDYTCAYISSSYCAANSLVVKNVAYRVLKAVKSLVDALTILYDYITKHDCGTNNDNKYALLVTGDTFGSVLCSADVLLEAVKYEYTIFVGMAGSNGYNSHMYGRASGGSSGYSPAYQGFPYGYGMANPYRIQRSAAVVPALTTPARGNLFVVG